MPVNRLQKQVDGCSGGVGIAVKPVALCGYGGRPRDEPG
jgi:hypothetical protein